MFFTVKPEYWSCMGETVLKKTQYNEDTAKARHQYRSEQDALMIAMRGGQRVETQVAQQTATQQTQLQQMLATAFRPLMQAIVIPVMQAFQNAAAFIKNTVPQLMQAFANAMAGMGANLGKAVQNAVSQVLSFFFGHKKENDKTDEKHQRDRTDAATTDLFGKTMMNEDNVEGAQNKFLGA